MDNRYVTDRQQVLAELAREGSRDRGRASALVWSGGGTPLWAIKVKNHIEDNVYQVRAVTIEEPGVLPVEFGEPMEAVNLAEPFLAPGTLAPGAYAILCRLGEKNVFYAVP